jgi:hypothetical protein
MTLKIGDRLILKDRVTLKDRTGTIEGFYDLHDGALTLVGIKWDEEPKAEAYTLARLEHDLASSALDWTSPRPQFRRYDGRGQQ